MIVLLLNDLYLAILDRKLKYGDQVVGHKLRSQCSADQVGKLLSAASDILSGLDHGQLIVPAFRLNGQNELPALTINSYIYLVNLNLADSSNRCSKMVLKGVCGEAKKDIDQTIVPNLR